MYNRLHSFQCKRLLPKSSKVKKKLTTKSDSRAVRTHWRHLLVRFLIHVQGHTKHSDPRPFPHPVQWKVNTILFRASLFMSCCTQLLEFWTLVRACLGSQGYRRRQCRCSIPQSQLQSPPPRTRRSGRCRRRTVRPRLFQNRSASARQNGR